MGIPARARGQPEQIGPVGCHRVDLPVAIARRGEANLKELEASLAIDQTTLTRSLGLLERDGVIERASHPDGRIKAIVDTKFDKNDPAIFKAKTFVEKVDEIWNLVRIEAIKAQEKRAP